MSIQIALIGEGKNDFGIVGRDGNWVEGAAQPLIRKFFPDAEIVPLMSEKQLRLPLIPGRNIPKLRGQANNLRHFIPHIAKKGTFDLLIYDQDLDKKHSGKAKDHLAKKAFREVMEDLDDGFRFIFQAFEMVGIAMIPMRMLENWLLADENAFAQHFGAKPSNPRLPNQPEFIWGDEQNPVSDHPKNYLRRVLAQYNNNSNTENFILIVQASSIETMKKSCSHSFAPFAAEMQKFVRLKTQ